jgi:tryptophan-rich sensory protein
MTIIDILKLVASIILCQMAGLIGLIFTTPAIPTWYESLKKPFFNPPNWIFGPVWVSLYLPMGISLFVIWQRRKNNPQARKGLVLFFAQLILNAFWSVAFFGLKSPLLGLIIIILLWFAIFFTIQHFIKISKIAALLLLPYILWVSFAVVLNLSLWILNM